MILIRSKFYSLYKAGVIFSLLLFANALFASQTNVEKMLYDAEKLRSGDFTAFSQILADLETNKQIFTADQGERFLFLKAYQTNFNGNYQAAINQLKELIEKTPSNQIKFKSLSVLINILMIQKKYDEVFLYLVEYEPLLQKVNDKDDRSHGFGVMAFVFNQIEQYDLGLYYADLQIADSGSLRFECYGMQFKLEALFRSGDIHGFQETYPIGVAKCVDANQLLYANIIRSFQIEFLIESDPKRAIAEIESLREEVVSTSYNLLISLYKTLLSLAYLQNGNVDLAYEQALRTLSDIDDENVNSVIIMLYETLYRVSKARGQDKDALIYHEIFAQKQKTYRDEKIAGLVAYNVAQANIEVKNQRIALLDKDNELLSLQKDLFEQEAKQNRLVVLILAFVLVIATTLAYRGMAGRKRFKKIAEYDQLTGISNRYHFNNQARIALDYCENNAKPAAVILFDLDYFKTINDTHGHASGDWALQQVVKTCRNFMRNNDVFGRIGGEEFAVVLPGCHADKAVMLAEICRDAIAAIDSSGSGKQFPLSASFGVSGSDTSGYQLKQLLADADHAMYQAKELGRDQVVAFSDYRSTV